MQFVGHGNGGIGWWSCVWYGKGKVEITTTASRNIGRYQTKRAPVLMRFGRGYLKSYRSVLFHQCFDRKQAGG